MSDPYAAFEEFSATISGRFSRGPFRERIDVPRLRTVISIRHGKGDPWLWYVREVNTSHRHRFRFKGDSPWKRLLFLVGDRVKLPSLKTSINEQSLLPVMAELPSLPASAKIELSRYDKSGFVWWSAPAHCQCINATMNARGLSRQSLDSLHSVVCGLAAVLESETENPAP